MTSLLLPDNVLNQLICNKCNKYLSVLPVKVYPNRQTLCGRCCDENDNGVKSLYEKLITTTLFRCVNRYDGCLLAINASQMKEHEEKCTGNTYKCVICNEYEGVSFDLINHYKNVHKKVLSHPIFFLNLKEDNESNFMYITQDFVFIIMVKVDFVKQQIHLFNINVGPISRAESIKHKFHFYSEDKLLYSTDVKKCTNIVNINNEFIVPFSSISNDVDSINCRLDVNLSEIYGGVVCENGERSEKKAPKRPEPPKFPATVPKEPTFNFSQTTSFGEKPNIDFFSTLPTFKFNAKSVSADKQKK
ncbi:unnamed protein product [Brassicogethes aeneus]|uniref:SIAH-type domain-containing protein n=1 Tax=Brassicogethes aeneus TaxID=1431903 RepID=A0A9P0BDS2_BRAAE|nr:unnamed protein product [Brassicogethes aeneus]